MIHRDPQLRKMLQGYCPSGKDSIPVSAKDSVAPDIPHYHPRILRTTMSEILCATHQENKPGCYFNRILPPAGRSGSGRQSPAIGHFYGRIVDAKTNKGLDGTSVQLVMSIYDTATHNRRDSVIRGAITPSNGDFSFENLPILGSYRLKLTAIGYKPVNQQVAFNLKDAQSADPEQRLGAIDKDLGNIKMEIDPTSLQQVTVTADKPLIQLAIDRKVYNVEKDLSAVRRNRCGYHEKYSFTGS